MTTYVLFMDKFTRNRNGGNQKKITKRLEVQASDIISACNVARAEIPGSEVSMVWSK